jgi:hypothetical protein
MKESFSYTQLVDLTGIPQTTLWNVINNKRELPYKYESNVTGVYAQTAYNNLTLKGANRDQAIAEMNDLPQNVRTYEQRWDAVASKLAFFRAGRYILSKAGEDDNRTLTEIAESLKPGAIQSMNKMFNNLEQAENFDFESPEFIYI